LELGKNLRGSLGSGAELGGRAARIKNGESEEVRGKRYGEEDRRGTVWGMSTFEEKYERARTR